MFKLRLRTIPEGVPYDEEDVTNEAQFNTPDEVVAFLRLRAAASVAQGVRLGELIFEHLAGRIEYGDRFGTHRAKVEGWLPVIVEWSLTQEPGATGRRMRYEGSGAN